ncbi:MAG: leucyl/phenylalanyl-tRNA--protein transferase [Planctomycetaceae bacterium]|jgi:leucyl/phenylalanyl-tRNA--protein transferase|nr:leucyl/phenylalanyl-tRNA--protein transferase [Planctomycetaceae bacterium]
MLHKFSPYSPSRFFSLGSIDEATGLVGFDGDLEFDCLIDAYVHGIFPWPVDHPVIPDRMVLAWFSPDPRGIFEYERFHVPCRLERLCRSGVFQIKFDNDFAGVIRGCSSAQDRRNSTWITPQMINAYVELHQFGVAHSVEAWFEGRLVGGVYGVALGGFFAAESMFYVKPNASKVALVALIRHLKETGYTLVDIQEITPNTARFGAVEIPRKDYLQRLHKALQLPVNWSADISTPAQSEQKIQNK